MSTTSEFQAAAPMPARKLPNLRLRAAVGRIPADVWAVGALTLVAALIRFVTIASQSYWADEALTAYEIHLKFGAMLTAVAHYETTPPLYFIVAWAWAHVFGTGEAALHSLSALAGIAVVPIAYLCGRDLVSRRAGVIAAAFAAVNPFMVWYSQEARSYMLLIALTGASFLWFIRAARDPTTRNIVWWTIFSALALATHFFAGFLVAPEAVWLLLRARSRQALIAGLALAAVQAALLPLAVGDTSHGVGWIHKTPLLTRVAQVPTEFAVMTIYRHVTDSQGLWGAGIVVAVAVLLLVLAGRRAERLGALAAAAIAVTVMVGPLVLGLVRPADDFFLVRNLSPAWIPLAVMLAAACAAPRARDVGTAAATVLLILFVWGTIEIGTNPVFQRADWRGVAHALGASSEPRAILVAGGQEALALQVYLPGVKWVQPPATQRFLVDQIAVVGSIAHAPLRGPGRRKGRALPVRAPRGAVLIDREWVRNFRVAEYQLAHPLRLDIHQLYARAGRFFHHAPAGLLVLIQHERPVPADAVPERVGRVVHRAGSARHGHRHRQSHRRLHRRHRARPPAPLAPLLGPPLQLMPSRQPTPYP
jgi:mannosyltransferase